MLLSWWNYWRGYVVIEVTGFSVERFINLAVYKGVYIWDAVYSEAGVTMKVSISGFRMLKSCAKKTKCHVKIVGKHGRPFLIHRYRKRKLLAGGVVFFVAALYAMSLFVWQVEVTGTKRLDPTVLVDFCQSQGVGSGTWKHKVDTKALEQQLMREYGEIGWVNIHMQGTKASIQIKETIPKQVMVDRKTPCNIVAAKDGLLVSVVTSGGTPLVKEGDVVKAGDILISAELVVKNDETGIIKEMVHADAQVMSKIYYEMNFDIDYTSTTKAFTENQTKWFELILWDFLVPLPKKSIPYENFEIKREQKQAALFKNFPLPIVLVENTCREFVPQHATHSAEQVKELAARVVRGRIIREFDFDADVMDISYVFTQNPQGVAVKALVTTYENIGIEKMLEPEPIPEPEPGLEPEPNQ